MMGPSLAAGTVLNPAVPTAPKTKLNTKNPACYHHETTGKALWENKEEVAKNEPPCIHQLKSKLLLSWRRWGHTDVDSRDVLSKNPHSEHQTETG